MNVQKNTPLPDSVIDIILKRLTDGEIKTLLVIYRYTWGVVENPVTDHRAQRAWISNNLLQKVTGLSARTINRTIDGLVHKKLIRVTNRAGDELHSSNQRSGTSQLYFEPVVPQKWNKDDKYAYCCSCLHGPQSRRFTLRGLLE
jgi:hypothetical protein